jgi:hypothetical protein
VLIIEENSSVSKIRQSLFLILLSQAVMPLASAQTEEKIREYGVNLSLDAARTWNDDGHTANNLNAKSSLLFLNQHFHFGPLLDYNRSYSSSYGSTSWGIGLAGKWTYENIQTADRTPFVEASASIHKGDSNDGWESTLTGTAVGVGYEVFLNPYVSLATSIVYNKFWSEVDDDERGPYVDEKDMQASAGLHLGLNVYL